MPEHTLLSAGGRPERATAGGSTWMTFWEGKNYSKDNVALQLQGWVWRRGGQGRVCPALHSSVVIRVCAFVSEKGATYCMVPNVLHPGDSRTGTAACPRRPGESREGGQALLLPVVCVILGESWVFCKHTLMRVPFRCSCLCLLSTHRDTSHAKVSVGLRSQ